MRQISSGIILCLILLLISACQTNKNTADVIQGQIGAANIGREYVGDLPQYPKTLESFTRDKIFVYPPKFDLSDYSVQYFYYENQSPVINSTYYLYDRAPYETAAGSHDPQKVFEQTLSTILSTQDNPKLIGKETMTTTLNGKQYTGYRASFIEDVVVKGQRGKLYGELIMVPLETKYLKLRMSATRSSNDVQQLNGKLLTALIRIADLNK